MVKLNRDQQLLAKGQCKNKCSTISSTECVQRTQL
jgi:hypothetical protein